MSSFHEKAIHFLCADQQWACKIWENFSSASPDLRLTLVAWVLDGQSLRQTGLKEVVQRVLQVKRDLFPTLEAAQRKQTFPKPAEQLFL